MTLRHCGVENVAHAQEGGGKKIEGKSHNLVGGVGAAAPMFAAAAANPPLSSFR